MDDSEWIRVKNHKTAGTIILVVLNAKQRELVSIRFTCFTKLGELFRRGQCSICFTLHFGSCHHWNEFSLFCILTVYTCFSRVYNWVAQCQFSRVSHSSSWVVVPVLSLYLYVCMSSWRVTSVFQSSFSVVCQRDGLSHVHANRCHVSCCCQQGLVVWYRASLYAQSSSISLCVGMASRRRVCSGHLLYHDVFMWVCRGYIGMVSISPACLRLGSMTCQTRCMLASLVYHDVTRCMICISIVSSSSRCCVMPFTRVSQTCMLASLWA